MNPAHAYRETDILSASPGRLLVLTFDGLLASLTRARAGLALSNDDVARSGTEKARALLCELLATLNHDVEGGLPERLAGIYVFLLGELDTTMIRRDTARLDRMIRMARDLRDAFEQASLQTPRIQLV